MTQKLSNAQWDSFYALRTRKRDNGLGAMPTAGPSPQAAQVVVLHGSLEWDIVAYTATKRGEPPTVPAPATTNPNRVFMGGWQSGIFPIPDQVGVMEYTVAGYMRFLILSPEGLESDFMLGKLPFPGLDPNEYISATQYLSYQLLNERVVPALPGAPVFQLAQVIRTISNEG